MFYKVKSSYWCQGSTGWRAGHLCLVLSIGNGQKTEGGKGPSRARAEHRLPRDGWTWVYPQCRFQSSMAPDTPERKSENPSGPDTPHSPEPC